MDRISTGVPGLDEVVGGGLPRNYVYLIEGDPGSGKTTMSMQFLMEGVRNGEKALYLTLSESVQELREVARSHDWNLDGIELFEPPLAKNPLLPDDQNTLFHPSEIELAETMKLLLEKIEEVKPDRIVLDSLSEIRLLAQTPLRYRRQVLAFKQYLTASSNSTVMLIDDRTHTDDIQMQSVPSGVIELLHHAPLYGTVRRKMRIVKIRGVRHLGGYHELNILKGGVRIYPRLIAADTRSQGEPLETISSGNRGIDRLLGGGLHRRTSTLITGASGAGKSSLATLYSVAAAERGEKVAIFTFDERRATAIERSRSLGIDLQKHIDDGTIHLQQIDPAEMMPGEFTDLVRRMLVDEEKRLFVIDSLNGYANSMTDAKFLTVQLHELLSYLAQNGATAILISTQHGLFDASPIGETDASYLADAVILLRYFEVKGTVRKAISVVKKRTGEHERTIRELLMSSEGISVGPPIGAFHEVLGRSPVFEGEQTPDSSDESE